MFNTSTTTYLNARFRNNKSNMPTKKLTCEVATHFNQIAHEPNGFTIIGMEQVHNTSDTIAAKNASSLDKFIGALSHVALSSITFKADDPEKMALSMVPFYL